MPYRPTVSTPATLSEPLWLEAEFGGLHVRDTHATDDAIRRTSAPYSLKYAFSEDWGIRLGGELLAATRDAENTRTIGFGDTAVIVKRRFAIDASSAFGLEAGVAFPTAKRALELGSGKPDWSINEIYSGDLGRWHGDVNVIETRLGGRQAAQSRLQTLVAAALSTQIVDRWTAACELSATHQRGTSTSAQVLGALSYAFRPDFVVDFGVAHSLNRATPTWQAFAGVTILLGRIGAP